MNTETTPWQKRQEIPDSQILDAANQFESARKLLADQPPGVGIVLALFNAGAVAIELYLKSLSAELIYTPIDDCIGGSLVTARPVRRDHKLVDLIDALEPGIGEPLIAAYSLQIPGASLRDDLVACEGLLVASRYPFEIGQKLDRYDLSVVSRCSDFLSQYTNSLEQVHLIHWK